MADAPWYYHHAGTQYGPVSFTQMQQLAVAGELSPDDLVWQQGMASWVAANTIEGLLPAPAEPAPTAPPAAAEPPAPAPQAPAPTAEDHAAAAERAVVEVAEKVAKSRDVKDLLPHLRIVEALLGVLRRVFSERLLDGIDSVAKLAGNIAYACAVLFSALFFVILAIKAEAFQMLLVAAAIIPIAILLQYVAVLFLDAGKTLIDKSPSALSSVAFLNSFGLVAIVGALAQLCLGVYAAFSGGGFPAFATGFAAFLVLLYAGGVGLNPQAVSVTVGEEVSAGEEAIGILSFLMKLFVLRLVPFAFGVGCVVGLFFILYVTVQIFGEGGAFVGLTLGMPAVSGVLALALLPFVAYLVFLLYYLGIDLVRSVLVMPGKLDTLIASSESTEEEEI